MCLKGMKGANVDAPWLLQSQRTYTTVIFVHRFTYIHWSVCIGMAIRGILNITAEDETCTLPPVHRVCQPTKLPKTPLAHPQCTGQVILDCNLFCLIHTADIQVLELKGGLRVHVGSRI